MPCLLIRRFFFFFFKVKPEHYAAVDSRERQEVNKRSSGLSGGVYRPPPVCLSVPVFPLKPPPGGFGRIFTTVLLSNKSLSRNETDWSI